MPPVVEAHARVLYADTDQMGVVNNMNYLRWFELGRAEWLRAQGWSYRDIEARGWQLPVVEAHLRYRAPARYDDELRVMTETAAPRAASVRFAYRIHHQESGRLLCEGHTLHACLDQAGHVRRLPDELLQLFTTSTA